MMSLAPEPAETSSDQLVDAFCIKCSRKTYVNKGADMFCPVCSSPLSQGASEVVTDLD